MKRSGPLRRLTPLRATQPSLKRTRLAPVSQAKRHWRREATALMCEYHATHERCAVCSISSFAVLGPERVIQLHHICGRGGVRFECQANYLCLCARDHMHYHHGGQLGDDGEPLPKLTGGHLLWAKRAADPEQFDAALLAGLRGWKGLPADWEPRELPAAFMAERANNWR